MSCFYNTQFQDHNVIAFSVNSGSRTVILSQKPQLPMVKYMEYLWNLMAVLAL